MDSTGTGFRVLEKLNPYFSADPKIVAYRLDPKTLDFSEVKGSPEQLLGFPVDQWFRPKFWCGRVHPEDRQAAYDFLVAWAEARRDHELEYRMLDAAGRTLWVHDIVEVRGEPPQETEIRGVLIDISDRVAHEADVKKALSLKNELFRIVAEELAQPVRSISAYGEMLERHLASQGDDVGSDYAIGLREGVQRLDELLIQLMRIAQNGDMSFDEMNACLAGIRSAGRRG